MRCGRGCHPFSRIVTITIKKFISKNSVLHYFDNLDRKSTVKWYIFSKAAQAALLKMYSFTDGILIIWDRENTANLKNTSWEAASKRKQPTLMDFCKQFQLIEVLYYITFLTYINLQRVVVVLRSLNRCGKYTLCFIYTNTVMILFSFEKTEQESRQKVSVTGDQ